MAQKALESLLTCACAKSILRIVRDVRAGLILGRAMCDHTFAPLLEQNCQKMLLLEYSRRSYLVLEHLKLLWNNLKC